MLPNQRFSQLVPDLSSKSVLVAGCGGLGSWTAVALEKLGIEHFLLYDFDKVEVPNVGTQVFSYDHVGMNKAWALQDILQTDINLVQWFDEDVLDISKHTFQDVDVVLALVDSIPVRQKLFEKWVEAGAKGLWLDGRMGAEVFEMHHLTNGSEFDKYTESFKGEFMEEPCGATATPYTGMLAAARMCTEVKTWVTSNGDYNSGWLQEHVVTGKSFRFPEAYKGEQDVGSTDQV